MQNSDRTYPAPISVGNPLWDVTDSSKLSSFLQCPRQYFYRYVLGWSVDRPNIHLVFGTAWHLAMEHLLLTYAKDNGYTPEATLDAYNLFLAEYRKSFPEDLDLSNSPKDPGTAFKALAEYSGHYRDDTFKVLYTEVAGSVLIDDSHTITFKIDAIIDGKEGIYCLDHKTTGSLRQAWQDQFVLCMQAGTYPHALYCMFPEEDIYGIIFNGVILTKDLQFKRVPVRKTNEQMAVWLWNTLYTINFIDWNFEQLANAKEGDNVLRAFPMNTESCTKYGTCSYHPYCTAWANPLQRCHQCPVGFKEEHWDPRSQQEHAKYVLENGKLEEVSHATPDA